MTGEVHSLRLLLCPVSYSLRGFLSTLPVHYYHYSSVSIMSDVVLFVFSDNNLSTDDHVPKKNVFREITGSRQDGSKINFQTLQSHFILSTNHNELCWIYLKLSVSGAGPHFNPTYSSFFEGGPLCPGATVDSQSQASPRSNSV